MWILLLFVVGPLTGRGEVVVAPDLVTLNSGNSLEGRVVYEDAQELVLRVKSRERVIDQASIASVRAALRELPPALDSIAALGDEEPELWMDLARDLEQRNLPLEAQLLYWKVLTLQSDHESANLALGHRKRKQSWVIPSDGRWWRLERLAERRKDFGKAWEFETTHYRLSTNLPLDQALRIAWDLERFYLAFYRQFGPGLQLHRVTEKMEAHVHATQSSFPQIGTGRPGYYMPSEGRLYLDASKDRLRPTLVHEGTHQLLNFSAVRMKPGKGRIPGWLDEGLAVYMETSMGGLAGKLVIEPGLREEGRFLLHAGEAKPYGLKRVLNFQTGDFLASSRMHLKYAQAYTLVFFCLHAERERYRGGFFAYLRGVYAGKASSTHFRKALGLTEKALEIAWLDYVRE